MGLQSFAVSVHLRGDAAAAMPLLRFLDREEADAAFLFGDLSGPVLTDAEWVLYQRAAALLREEGSIQAKAHAARALLAQTGLGEDYREALQLYLKKIADADANDEIVWGEAYQRTVSRLRAIAERFSPYPYAALADSDAAEEAFGDRILDFETLSFGDRTLKAVGLSPEEGIHVPAERMPEELLLSERRSVPLSDYLASFDILIANALPPALQSLLERFEDRLLILPGDRPDVSDFKGTTLAFEAPGTFSVWRIEGDRILRHVQEGTAAGTRLVRRDTFDADFKLLKSKTDFSRKAVSAAAPRRSASRQALGQILEEARREQPEKETVSLAPFRRRRGGGALEGFLRLMRTDVRDLVPSGGGSARPRLLDIPIGQIRDNPEPLREHLDPGEIDRLAQSIREFGIVVPLIVKRVHGGYEVVAGQRRLTAARRAGLSTLPVIVRSLDDRTSAEVCYLENLHRVDLKPVEDAEAFERLVWQLRDFTRGQLAKKLGLEPGDMKAYDEILRLPVILREAMSMGVLDLDRAKCLARVADEPSRLALLRRTLKEGLSLEALSRLADQPVPVPAKPNAPSAPGGEAPAPAVTPEAFLEEARKAVSGVDALRKEFEALRGDDLRSLETQLAGLKSSIERSRKAESPEKVPADLRRIRAELEEMRESLLKLARRTGTEGALGGGGGEMEEKLRRILAEFPEQKGKVFRILPTHKQDDSGIVEI